MPDGMPTMAITDILYVSDAIANFRAGPSVEYVRAAGVPLVTVPIGVIAAS